MQASSQQILIFGLGEEWYGLEIDEVQEVVAAPRLHAVPRAPCCLSHAINFHGRVVVVLDLPAWLGFERGKRDPRVIVLSAPSAGLALAVDRVGRIVPLEDDAVMPCESEEDARAFIRGVFDHQGRMINLLDTDRLLASLRQDANLRGGTPAHECSDS